MELRGPTLTRREALKLPAGFSLLPLAAAAPQTAAPASLPLNVIYYGSAQPLPPVLELKAGALTMVFEVETGFLRTIKANDVEAVRAVYAAVRDRNWGTVTPRIHNLKHVNNDASFELDFDAECKRDDIDFFWHGRITGSPDSVVRFSFEGKARSTFLRNRLGFCVLHPIEGCAGRPCEVETVDGKKTRGNFPKDISPNQPFFDLRAISHAVAPGQVVEVRMEGDTFEMEDQRNWTDASYKTYCTPLSIPYPVEVKAGTEVKHTVTVRFTAKGQDRRARVSVSGGPVPVRAQPSIATPVPKIGFGLASHGQPLSAREIDLLKAAKPAHLRVDLRPGDSGLMDAARRAGTESQALGARAEVAVFLGDSPEGDLAAVLKAAAAARLQVARWMVYHSKMQPLTEEWLKAVRKVLGRTAVIAGGTDDSFVALNRNRPPVDLLDKICFSINPQVHAFDNLTLVENLSAQAEALSSAKKIAGEKPLVVSAVTLKPRFNPVATGAVRPPRPDELPPQVDVRQMSLFGAAWTLGSLKYLSEGGVEAVTMYETSGWRGLLETAAGSPAPTGFPTVPGAVFPLYHVLADAGEFAGGQVLRSRSARPMIVESLLLRNGARTRWMLANLTGRPQTVRLSGVDLGPNVRVRRLDESSARAAMETPDDWRRDPGLLAQPDKDGLEVALPPFASASVDPARA